VLLYIELFRIGETEPIHSIEVYPTALHDGVYLQRLFNQDKGRYFVRFSKGHHVQKISFKASVQTADACMHVAYEMPGEKANNSMDTAHWMTDGSEPYLLPNKGDLIAHEVLPDDQDLDWFSFPIHVPNFYFPTGVAEGSWNGKIEISISRVPAGSTYELAAWVYCEDGGDAHTCERTGQMDGNAESDPVLGSPTCGTDATGIDGTDAPIDTSPVKKNSLFIDLTCKANSQSQTMATAWVRVKQKSAGLQCAPYIVRASLTPRF
jgi:hypothetical protein